MKLISEQEFKTDTVKIFKLLRKFSNFVLSTHIIGAGLLRIFIYSFIEQKFYLAKSRKFITKERFSAQ